MLLHWLDFYGHKSIGLIGGGTTLIGDPSGKDETRKILTKEEIDKNIGNIKQIFSRFINLNKDALIINNYDWLSKLNYIDFLREFASKITLNRMLTFESVKSRLDREQPLTILEFNYMLLQAYDFVYLNKKQNSISEIERYNKNKASNSIINEISNITSEILVCNSLDRFNKLIEAHELIISKLISKKTIKEALFKDFDGYIKSLGAWGGDMIMVTSQVDPSKYFIEKGYSTIFKFKELLV